MPWPGCGCGVRAAAHAHWWYPRAAPHAQPLDDACAGSDVPALLLEAPELELELHACGALHAHTREQQRAAARRI
jgi:hypothetical protein